MIHSPMQRCRTVHLRGIDIGLLREKRSKCSFVAFHDRIGYIRAAGGQTHSCAAKKNRETHKHYSSNHYSCFSIQLPAKLGGWRDSLIEAGAPGWFLRNLPQ